MKYGLSERTLQKIQGVLSHYPQVESAIFVRFGALQTPTEMVLISTLRFVVTP